MQNVGLRVFLSLMGEKIQTDLRQTFWVVRDDQGSMIDRKEVNQ